MSTTISAISQRELEILKLVSYGYRTVDIAEQLFISPHTVLSHRKNLMIKLDVKNTARLIRRGFELNYLSLLKDREHALAS